MILYGIIRPREALEGHVLWIGMFLEGPHLPWGVQHSWIFKSVEPTDYVGPPVFGGRLVNWGGDLPAHSLHAANGLVLRHYCLNWPWPVCIPAELCNLIHYLCWEGGILNGFVSHFCCILPSAFAFSHECFEFI